MFLQIIHALIYSPRRQVKYIILISLILILSACSMPKVHKIIIQQGNIVNQEMVDQLKPGMTKTQVAYIMGEPVLKNTFDENRWDYLYTLELPGVLSQKMRMSLFFDGEILGYFTGDLAPSELKHNL